MKNINVPSYNSLLPTERRIRSIQELYDYINKWNSEVGGLIPPEASPENQLATKEDVATSSATYRGSYNLVSDLNLTVAATESDVAAALATTVTTADNNDYVNVQIPSSDADPTSIIRADRYKFNETDWIFEYSQDAGPSADVELIINKVASISAQSTDIQYPSAKCMYDEIGDIEAVLDAILGGGGGGGEGKEDKLTIVSYATAPATISAEVSKYYRIDADVDTLAVTLPAMTDNTKAVGMIFLMTIGTTPNVTITPTAPSGGTAPDIYYQEGYATEAGKTYEINCLWNGVAWIVVSTEIEIV